MVEDVPNELDDIDLRLAYTIDLYRVRNPLVLAYPRVVADNLRALERVERVDDDHFAIDGDRIDVRRTFDGDLGYRIFDDFDNRIGVSYRS